MVVVTLNPGGTRKSKISLKITFCSMSGSYSTCLQGLTGEHTSGMHLEANMRDSCISLFGPLL